MFKLKIKTNLLIFKKKRVCDQKEFQKFCLFQKLVNQKLMQKHTLKFKKTIYVYLKVISCLVFNKHKNYFLSFR